MDLGKNILKLRKEKNLSQENLAEKLNVTRQTISNWELGETGPTPEQLKKISQIFKISIDKLLDNNIDNILEQKVSNTEKLAGIIIKILKAIGIGFLVLLIVDILALILFSVLRTTSVTEETQEVTFICNINDSNYNITIGSDEYFECLECDKKLLTKLEQFVDYSNLNTSVTKIENYFKNNNGFCY